MAAAAAFLIAVAGVQANSEGQALTTTHAWSGWINLRVITASGASAISQGGQTELFYQGTDNKLWEDWESTGTGQWSGAIPVRPDGALAGTPLAISPIPGVVDVFVRGTDSHIWETSYTDGSWSPWTAIGAASDRTPYSPGGVVQSNQIDLFVTGADGRLYEDYQDLASQQWTGFFLVTGQGTLGGSPVAVSPASGTVQVFGAGTDWPHHVYRVTYSSGWSGWSLVGTSTNVTRNDPAATVQGGSVALFVTGTDGRLWGTTEVGSTWTGFGLVNGRGTLSSGPAAVASSNGLLAVFGAGTDNPHHIYEISNTGTGVYGCSSMSSCLSMVQAVVSGAWAGVGSNSGWCPSPSASYACPTGADSGMEQGLQQAGGGIFWLSFWTIGAPVAASASASPDDSPNGWRADGFTAGRTAATEIIHLGGGYVPDFEILDAEGFGGYPGEAPCTGSPNSTCWGSWLNGWAAGLTSVSSRMHPAFYTSQNPIQQNNLLSLGLPAFPAVSPIQGNTPFVTGSTVTGYIAYTAQCTSAGNDDPDALQISNWGAQFNTVQFPDSAVDCPA